MKLIFSECNPNYSVYTFPYVIWAVPDNIEEVPDVYERGFLPSRPPRYYLARSTRVVLENFQITYRNRQILKKCIGIEFELLAITDFKFSAHIRDMCLTCARERYGKGVIDSFRLDRIFNVESASHVMQFSQDGEVVGVVTINRYFHIAHYNFGFFKLDLLDMSFGINMLLVAIRYFKGLGFLHVYLGTCYSESSLYKSKIRGFEFFNGRNWSANIDELSYLIKNYQGETHLLESEEYLEKFDPLDR